MLFLTSILRREASHWHLWYRALNLLQQTACTAFIMTFKSRMKKMIMCNEKDFAHPGDELKGNRLLALVFVSGLHSILGSFSSLFWFSALYLYYFGSL